MGCLSFSGGAVSSVRNHLQQRSPRPGSLASEEKGAHPGGGGGSGGSRPSHPTRRRWRWWWWRWRCGPPSQRGMAPSSVSRSSVRSWLLWAAPEPPALYSAPRLQLPPGPRAGHGCCPRLVRSGAGRPQGALALPDPRSGRPCQGGSAGCGCARRLVCVLELATMCSLREAKCFYTFRNVFLLSECRWGYFESLALVRSPASLRPCGPRGRVCNAISRSRVHKCLGALRLKSGLSTTMGHSGRARLASIWAGFLGHDPQHLSAVPGREPAPCAQGPPGLPDFKRASSKDPCGAKQSPCMQLF